MWEEAKVAWENMQTALTTVCWEKILSNSSIWFAVAVGVGPDSTTETPLCVLQSQKHVAQCWQYNANTGHLKKLIEKVSPGGVFHNERVSGKNTSRSEDYGQFWGFKLLVYSTTRQTFFVFSGREKNTSTNINEHSPQYQLFHLFFMLPPGDSTQLKQEDVGLQSFAWHLQSTKALAELFTMLMGKVAYTLEVQWFHI